MSTTTIRLPEDLKIRVARAAERTGATTHAFILEAIAQRTAQEEQLADFDAVAEERFARIVATAKTIPWKDMRTWLEDRAAGKPSTRPSAKKLAP